MVAAVIALLAGGVAAPQAQANAFGCTASGFGLPQFGLSSAYNCLEVNGYGLNVRNATVSWRGGGVISNYQFKLRWYDRFNNLYLTSVGPYKSGSRFGYASFRPRYGGDFREGRVCGELYVSGSLRGGRPCVSIFP